MNFSKERRKEIIKAHIEKHGTLNLRQFVDAARNPKHPAHNWSGWMGWDEKRLAGKALLDQAKEFVNIRVEVQAPIPQSPVNIIAQSSRMKEVPLLVSPKRSKGQEDEGGYQYTMTQEGLKALRAEALSGPFGLTQFINRYESIFSVEEEALFKKGLTLLGG